MAVDTSAMTWNGVMFRAADAYLNGTGDNPPILDDILAELEAIDDTLSEPVAYLPLPGAAASDDATLTRVLNNISTATDTAIVSATASQTTRVYRLLLTCAGANVLTFKSAAAAIFPAITFGAAGGSVTLDFSGYWWMKTVANEALNLTTTTTAAVGVATDYIKSA
jgi:hypothetical protein